MRKFVGVDQFLQFGHIKRLGYGGWLNDVIVAGYLSIMDRKIKKCMGEYKAEGNLKQDVETKKK